MYVNSSNNLNNNLEFTDLLAVIADTLQVINTVKNNEQDQKINEILKELKEQKQLLQKIIQLGESK